MLHNLYGQVISAYKILEMAVQVRQAGPWPAKEKKSCPCPFKI